MRATRSRVLWGQSRDSGGWIGRLAPLLTRFWLFRLSVLGGSDGCRLRCRRQQWPKWVLCPVLRWRRPGAPPSPPRARAAPAPPPRTTCCCGSKIIVFQKSTHRSPKFSTQLLFLQHRRSSCTKFTKFSNLTLSALVFCVHSYLGRRIGLRSIKITPLHG